MAEYVEYEDEDIHGDPYIEDEGHYADSFGIQDDFEDFEDEYEEDLEDVQISDSTWYEPEGDIEGQPWIPAPPIGQPSSRIMSGQQQYMTGYPPAFAYPPITDLTSTFCQLHPEECGSGGGPALVETNSSLVNETAIDEPDGAISLSNVDMPGVGLALLLILIIFLGLHIAWDKGDEEAKGGEEFYLPPTKRRTFEGLMGILQGIRSRRKGRRRRQQPHLRPKLTTQLEQRQNQGRILPIRETLAAANPARKIPKVKVQARIPIR